MHDDLEKAKEIAIEGLLGEKPKLVVDGVPYRTEWDDDIGSTLYFDKTTLKRIHDEEKREIETLTLVDTSHEKPLVSVTSKRLKLL